MSGVSKKKLLTQIITALGDTDDDGSSAFPLLYEPHKKLKGLISELDKYVKKTTKPTATERKAAGDLLEEVAAAVFAGLAGYDHLASYQGPGPQIDLLINGSTFVWQYLCKTLRINTDRRGFLLEAKATESKITDEQFARLCGLIHTNFHNSVSLGVFFSLHGATGFPEAGATKADRKIGQACLRQALFHARTKIPVVVFDWNEIKALTKVGAFPKMLETKIRSIDEQTGIAPAFNAKVVAMPPRFSSLFPPSFLLKKNVKLAKTAKKTTAKKTAGKK